MPKAQAASQDFVSIRDIKENVVFMKNGQMCMILLASSINFALKSLDEQKSILFQFQQFLNTLDFSLQIFVQSRKLNIDPYIATLQQLETKQENELMRTQLREYMEFVRTFTEDADVMSKNFFVVIPFNPNKIDIGKGITSMFAPKQKKIAVSDEATFEENRIQLEQRVGMVTEGLARIGVRTITLGKDDLVEMFYHLYNPADPKGSAPSVDT